MANTTMKARAYNLTGLEKSYTTKNKRSVWWVSPKPFNGAHFAVFPPELIEPCVLAGCPKGGVVLDPFGGSGTTGAVAKTWEKGDIVRVKRRICKDNTKEDRIYHWFVGNTKDI